MRISPLILFIDEYSYYRYHAGRYDRSFTFISRLCWDWTNEKWVPPLFDTLYDSYDKKITAWIDISQNPAEVPMRFLRFNEDCIFLNNTQDYWFVTIPLTVLTFLLLQRLFNCFRRFKLSKIIRPFCTIVALIMTLVGDNIQYLSFRAFQQLVYLQPQPGVSFALNLILTITALFIAVFCAVAMPFIILRYRKKQFEH